MDAQRFDELTRLLGRRTSRRAVLRGAAGGVAVGALARSDRRPAAAQDGCDEGETQCGEVCVDLMTDMDHCGACDAVCESGLVGVACIEGECLRVTCPAALTDCGDGDGPLPYEEHCFDLSSDPNNCGDCGVVCDSGECADATCVPSDDGETDGNGTTTLPDTGSGSGSGRGPAAGRPANWAPAALVAGAAALGAAALRRAMPRVRVE